MKNWHELKPRQKQYSIYTVLHGVPYPFSEYIKGTRAVETLEQVEHEDHRSIMTHTVKSLDLPISCCYYYKSLWIVIGRPGVNFSILGRLMKTELKYYIPPLNELIIRRTLEEIVIGEQKWWDHSIESGLVKHDPKYEDPEYGRLVLVDLPTEETEETTQTKEEKIKVNTQNRKRNRRRGDDESSGIKREL